MSSIETFDLRSDRFFPAELVLSSSNVESTLVALAENILFLRSINTASSVLAAPRIPSDEAFVSSSTNNKNQQFLFSGAMPSSSLHNNNGSFSQQQQLGGGGHFASSNPAFELRLEDENGRLNSNRAAMLDTWSVNKSVKEISESFDDLEEMMRKKRNHLSKKNEEEKPVSYWIDFLKSLMKSVKRQLSLPLLI